MWNHSNFRSLSIHFLSSSLQGWRVSVLCLWCVWLNVLYMILSISMRVVYSHPRPSAMQVKLFPKGIKKYLIFTCKPFQPKADLPRGGGVKQILHRKQQVGFKPEGSATKEISYTSWRNQLKSSWNQVEIMRNQSRFPWNQARKSAQPSSPTHFYNAWRHFWGKSRGNQREIRKSRTPKLLVADPSFKPVILVCSQML